MTYKEKQDLTELLGELPEDKQARVVQIVAERHAELGGNEDDLIEINIEELDSVTLWKLDRYVRSASSPRRRNRRRRNCSWRRSAWSRRRSASSCRWRRAWASEVTRPRRGGARGGGAAAKGNDSDATSDSSSGSDSDSDSDSDSYDSAEGGGSNPKGGRRGGGERRARPGWRRRRRRLPRGGVQQPPGGRRPGAEAEPVQEGGDGAEPGGLGQLGG